MAYLWNDAKAETPVLWPPQAKSWLIGKDSDAGRDWGQEEKGTTEDEMAGWHHWLDGRESEWTPGAGVGQGGLACCDSWGHKESDTTEWLIWSDDQYLYSYLHNRILIEENTWGKFGDNETNKKNVYSKKWRSKKAQSSFSIVRRQTIRIKCQKIEILSYYLQI